MFVIIEGPKCCGKTTLCNRLAREYGGRIIHFPTDSPTGKLALETLANGDYDECQELMEKDIDETLSTLDPTKLWILDRSFISNAVYRNTENLVIKDKYIDVLNKSMLVVLLASTDDLNEWIKLRVDKPLNATEYSKLDWSNNRFHRVAEMLGCVDLDRVEEIKVGKWCLRRCY